MTLAIEPMVNYGERYVRTLPDNWTVVTRDKSLVLILNIPLSLQRMDMKY